MRKSGKSHASKPRKLRNGPRVSRSLPMAYNPPRSKRVLLVYTDIPTVVEGTAGSGAFQYYRLNSAYDVNTAFASTSTPGFAEWSGFYSNYRVWRTRVRIEGTVSGVSTGGIGTVCLVVNPLQPTLPSSPATWPVQFMTIHKTVVNTTSGGTNTVTLDKTYNLPTVFRVTPSQFKNDFDFSATTSANPTRQGYFAVTISGKSSTPMSLTAQVYVSMVVEFFNPVLLSS